MGTQEIIESLRFVVDAEGRVTSVVLTPELWHRVVERIEAAEDRRLLEEMAPKLRRGPEGALRWADSASEWD